MLMFFSSYFPVTKWFSDISSRSIWRSFWMRLNIMDTYLIRSHQIVFWVWQFFLTVLNFTSVRNMGRFNSFTLGCTFNLLKLMKKITLPDYYWMHGIGYYWNPCIRQIFVKYANPHADLRFTLWNMNRWSDQSSTIPHHALTLM